tara:strand:+ start:108 stop:308 length:201 start_codon:yes stop_codon:yes gene_type:complete
MTIIIRSNFLNYKKVPKVKPLNFFSNDMTVAKDQLDLNHLKLTYQRNLINDLDKKHKDWAQEDTAN